MKWDRFYEVITRMNVFLKHSHEYFQVLLNCLMKSVPVGWNYFSLFLRSTEMRKFLKERWNLLLSVWQKLESGLLWTETLSFFPFLYKYVYMQGSWGKELSVTDEVWDFIASQPSFHYHFPFHFPLINAVLEEQQSSAQWSLTYE